MTEDDEEEDPVLTEEWAADLHWVTEQVAIGGCFPMELADDLRQTHGISAIVDLRAEECDDAAALGAAGIDLLHLPTTDMQAASDEHLEQGVAFVRERALRGDKVLIHCQHGIGRSALLALCVLVDTGWQPLDALAHLKEQREVVSPSRSQYEGWANWLRSRGLRPPDYHSFGCIAYRHLASR